MEKKWREVRAYDSRDIEQWLDNSLAVKIWFAKLLSIYPFDGILTAHEFWEEWSCGGNIGTLVPETIVSGREKECQILNDFLIGTPDIIGVRASTQTEALAFIVACAKMFENNTNDLFFSKTVIIDTEANYRGIRINTTALNLIPRFDNRMPLHAAISKGHHIIIPLGADDPYEHRHITLPKIDRDGQIEGLKKLGLDRSKAENFSRESGRDITILKKLLGFVQNRANWMKNDNASELLPAMLVGRWDESYIGDQELISLIAGESFNTYTQKLHKWLQIQEAPLIKIGNVWRLTSALDSWTNLSVHLTDDNFMKLKTAFLSAFKNGNPDIPIENVNDNFGSFVVPQKKFSSWIREGLAQTLILMSVYGDKLNPSKVVSLEEWVNDLIDNLFENARPEFLNPDFAIGLSCKTQWQVCIFNK